MDDIRIIVEYIRDELTKKTSLRWWIQTTHGINSDHDYQIIRDIGGMSFVYTEILLEFPFVTVTYFSTVKKIYDLTHDFDPDVIVDNIIKGLCDCKIGNWRFPC
jgi:hypothetical protein